MPAAISAALDRLVEYPALETYIKEFNGAGGFMFTVETAPERRALQLQLEDLLDDGSHSGASWAFLLRGVQAVLTGTVTRAQLEERSAAAAGQAERAAALPPAGNFNAAE